MLDTKTLNVRDSIDDIMIGDTPGDKNVDNAKPSQQIPMKALENEKKIKKAQMTVYIVSYIAYSCIHFHREFWSMSKRMIVIDPIMGPALPKSLMSKFDSSWLLSYAICMYIGGAVGDIFNQRKVLTIAYFGLSLCMAAQAFAGFMKITHEAFYFIVFPVLGMFNSVVFPTFVSVLANWFPKKNRGFFIGLWATCNNFGNIVGIQLSAYLLDAFNGSWPMLLATIAVVIFIMAFLIYFYVIAEPEELGLTVRTSESNHRHQTQQTNIQLAAMRENQNDLERIENNKQNTETPKTIGLIKAWFIPGVFQYAATFFCLKFAVYSMLLWLQLYLKEKDYTRHESANVSTVFDFGALFGSMTLGFLSDKLSSKRSPVAYGAIILAITISYIVTFTNEMMSKIVFTLSLGIFGFFMSGLNNLVQASCAADIGKARSLQSNEKSTTTVIGIIDASGAFGSAIGQLIIGETQKRWGWHYGFWLIISLDMTLVIIPLSFVLYREVGELMRKKNEESDDKIKLALIENDD